MTKQLPSVNVGVDVGKSQLDLYLLERERALTVPNEEQAILALVRTLGRYRVERIVIEATGRLEQPFVRAALAAGLPVIVVSPLKIRRFADAIGQLAKTDAIDARLIAQFAATVKPLARPASDANAQAIKDLVVRRRQLTALRTMEKNRRQVMPQELKSGIDRIIKTLDQELKRLEQLIDTPSINMPLHATSASCSPRCPASATPSPPLSSVISQSSALSIVARSLPSPASLPSTATAASFEANATSAAAVLTLVPRSILSAMVASRFNPDIKRFYERLVDAGKHKKVALTACIRKIVTTLNAMLRDNSPWRPAIDLTRHHSRLLDGCDTRASHQHIS